MIFDVSGVYDNLSTKILIRIMGSLHEDLSPLMTISRWILLRMSISQQVVEEMKTHILSSVPSSGNLVIYEIRWKNKT